jgi:RHS repeat-associated protein
VVARNVYGVAVTNITSYSFPSSVTLAYDNNGNLTNDGGKFYAYDAENRLTNAGVAGQWQSQWVYDGLSRRRVEKDFAWNGSSWVETNEVHIIYDGLLPVQNRSSNNTVLVTYTRGLDESGTLDQAGGIGGLLARTDPNGTSFYHSDGNGNITALMDGAEFINARYEYNPFGVVIGQWGTLAAANEMQFSSMPRLGPSDLTGFAYRTLNRRLQRWQNQDPIGEYGGINLYGYVGNNPVNRVDPFGLQLEFFADPRIVTPPIEPLAPRPVGVPLPRVPGVSYPEGGPFPPSGTVENPFRPGSFGRYFPNPKNPAKPKFEECWRFDKGDSNESGWKGVDHFHHWGDDNHMENPPPFQWFSVPPVMNNENAPSITYPPGMVPTPSSPAPSQPQRDIYPSHIVYSNLT